MRRFSIRACAAPAVLALLLFSAARGRAQDAKFTVNDDCTAFAFSPDGTRIVYAARRFGSAKIKTGRRDRKVRTEHDDIWEVDLKGHTHRMVDGSKLVQSPVPVSFSIRAIRIAPDNQHMTIEMETRTLTPQGEREGTVKSGEVTDLMDGTGKEIQIEGTKNSAIVGARNAAWLADGETVVYMKQPKDSLLYTLAYVRPSSGRGGAMLEGRSYAAVTWSPAHNVAAAIERNADLSGPIHLVWIDLVHQTQRTLATLEGFTGHLTVSPSATKIAYYRDGNTIEIRSVASPDQATQIKVPYGRYEWSADGTHLLLKRGRDDQTNQLIWISLPGGQYRDVFHGLLYHNFHVSPDGRWVGLTEPGRQILKLFPVP